MIAFEDYSKIKNNYCLCYFGQCNEYLILMELLRPRIELAFPGMNFYIGCRDESIQFLQTRDKVLAVTELKLRKNEFAHIKELKYEDGIHPIQKILVDSDITNIILRHDFDDQDSGKAVILTHSTYPTNPMNSRQIDIARRVAESRGLEVEISDQWKNSGLIIGVESPELVLAAYSGIPTILVETGIGSSFYKNLFPSMELLSS